MEQEKNQPKQSRSFSPGRLRSVVQPRKLFGKQVGGPVNRESRPPMLGGHSDIGKKSKEKTPETPVRSSTSKRARKASKTPVRSSWSQRNENDKNALASMRSATTTSATSTTKRALETNSLESAAKKKRGKGMPQSEDDNATDSMEERRIILSTRSTPSRIRSTPARRPNAIEINELESASANSAAITKFLGNEMQTITESIRGCLEKFEANIGQRLDRTELAIAPMKDAMDKLVDLVSENVSDVKRSEASQTIPLDQTVANAVEDGIISAAAPLLPDCALLVGLDRVPVNKEIISACSPYFAELFKNANEIDIKEFSVENIQTFIDVIHPPELETEINDENVPTLLNMARCFSVRNLTDRCERFLTGSSKIPLREKLALSQKYRLVGLQDWCVREHSKDVEAGTPQVDLVQVMLDSMQASG